jgi:uncharacterized protein (DUF2141 family)
MNTSLKRFAAGAGSSLTGLVLAASFVGSVSAASTPQMFKANLTQMNKSGANGTLTVKLDGNMATVTETVNGVLKGSPHAQHLHWGKDASHTCPTMKQDANGDGVVSTLEGAKQYGSVNVSLTKTGDTSAKAALALKDFPTAPSGTINYSRTIKLSSDQVKHLTSGQYVAVVHGIDVNGNGKYDTDAGTSPLAASAGMKNFPLEGTAPAACGVVLAAANSTDNGNNANTPSTNNTSNMGNSDNGASSVAWWGVGLGIAGVVLALIAMAMAAKGKGKSNV